MLAYRERRKMIAPESTKTKRAREKLLRQWKEQDSLITPQALADTIDKIYKWIAVNASHRVAIKKALSLFDQGENAAVLSGKVQQLASKIQVEMTKAFVHSESGQ